FLFFFFQAEDGIRDLIVTGVQTCALPISSGGIFNSPPRRTAWTSRLSSGLPGTTTGPSSPPAWTASAESSRSPPRCFFGPWQPEIGRASCRERVESAGVGGAGKKKRK